MDWDDVRVFLVLLEMRNLYDAGKRLGVDRSTVSRRLTGLERLLGTRLFARTREGLKATAAAEQVRPFAEKMAVDAADFERAARTSEERATGSVRIATTEAIATFLVDRGILATSEQHPDLRIELISSNAPVDLLRGEADMAVRVSPLRHASLRVRRVARLKIGLFASPSYIERRGRPVTPASLRGHDVILPAGELAQLPEALWLEARSGVRVVFRSNSMPALLSAAASGLGIVPLATGWGDLDRRLVRLQLLDDVPSRTIWIVTPPATGTRTAVRVVADRIAGVLARI
jgi:DNA-binding transcriptional LysR family regulator